MSKNGVFHITVQFVNLNNHYLFNSCQHILQVHNSKRNTTKDSKLIKFNNRNVAVNDSLFLFEL